MALYFLDLTSHLSYLIQLYIWPLKIKF